MGSNWVSLQMQSRRLIIREILLPRIVLIRQR